MLLACALNLAKQQSEAVKKGGKSQRPLLSGATETSGTPEYGVSENVEEEDAQPGTSHMAFPCVYMLKENKALTYTE